MTPGAAHVEAHADTQEAPLSGGDGPAGAPSSCVRSVAAVGNDLFGPGDLLGGNYEILRDCGSGAAG